MPTKTSPEQVFKRSYIIGPRTFWLGMLGSTLIGAFLGTIITFYVLSRQEESFEKLASLENRDESLSESFEDLETRFTKFQAKEIEQTASFELEYLNEAEAKLSQIKFEYDLLTIKLKAVEKDLKRYSFNVIQIPYLNQRLFSSFYLDSLSKDLSLISFSDQAVKDSASKLSSQIKKIRYDYYENGLPKDKFQLNRVYIRRSDNIFSLARRYKTTPEVILHFSPGLTSYDTLATGKRIQFYSRKP